MLSRAPFITRRMILASMIAASFLLAACSESPRESAMPAPASSMPAAAADDTAATSANVVFTSTPATIRACDATDGNATVALNWDVTAASIGFVTIQVGDQVFAEGISTGTASTGPWVRADTVFTLLDAATRKSLATLQIPFVEC